jgi:transposase-like protein
MKYSNGFRHGVMKRVLPPESQPVKEVSREVGISEQTIRNWMEKARNGRLDLEDGEIAPGDRQASEKFKLVIESKSIEPERMGEWLRGQGLHSEHVTLWEKELATIVANKDDATKAENQRLKKKLKETERELARKEKALAELAALLALKKKAEAIWGDDEEG